jgi:hypothetical protein
MLTTMLGVKAQLPSTCTGSWERYVATPDPLYKSLGLGTTHFEWILDHVDTFKTFGAGNDSIKVQWGQDTGTFRIGIREISDYGCEGDTIWANIKVNGVTANLADVEYNENDNFSLAPTGNTPFDSVVWNGSITSQTYSGVALTTNTVNVDVYKKFTGGLTCNTSDAALMTVHPLPRFVITSGGKEINDTSLCGSEKLTVTAGNLSNVTYQWYNGSTSNSITLDALPSSYSKPLDSVWVVVTNEFGGKYSDTMIFERCKGYIIALDNFKNTFPKSFRSLGSDPSFKVHIIGTTVESTDIVTIWYYVAEDGDSLTQVTFDPGQESATVTIKGKNYESYFNGAHDALRTVKIAKAQISSGELKEFLGSEQPSGIFYIIHRPRIKDANYIP